MRRTSNVVKLTRLTAALKTQLCETKRTVVFATGMHTEFDKIAHPA